MRASVARIVWERMRSLRHGVTHEPTNGGSILQKSLEVGNTGRICAVGLLGRACPPHSVRELSGTDVEINDIRLGIPTSKQAGTVL